MTFYDNARGIRYHARIRVTRKKKCQRARRRLSLQAIAPMLALPAPPSVQQVPADHSQEEETEPEERIPASSDEAESSFEPDQRNAGSHGYQDE